MRRWSALSYDQLISRLSTIEVYEVEHDFKKYQVEIEILEKREDYVHVAVSVDDGTYLPRFVRQLRVSYRKNQVLVLNLA